MLTCTFTETSKESENLSGFRNVKQTKQDNLPGKKQFHESTSFGDKPSESSESQTSDNVDIVSKELEVGKEVNTDSEKTETVESDCDADDASSTRSSVTSESASEPDNPGKPPPRPPRPPPPRPSKTSSASSESELTGDFKSRILGSPAGPAFRDLTKKGKPSGPAQVDFRGQLKKTGLRADKDLTAQGKKQQQFRDGDFRGQLKATGMEPSRNLSAPRIVGKKKEGPAQVDFRGNLKGESVNAIKAPPRPPPTYLTKKTEAGASTSQSSATSQTTKDSAVSKGEDKPAESSGRRISSADLLNMLHKPVESSKEGYLVQRGLKKAEASKSAPQKFGAPAVNTSTEDEKFRARMAQRKERSEKQLLPGKGARTERKMSAGLETKDFQSILKKAGVQQSRVAEKIGDAEGDSSTR